jgi:hypothetical protein
MKIVSVIINELDNYQPLGGWRDLDVLLGELWATQRQKEAIPNLFNILERFPKDDGAGVLYSVLHGLESIEGYEIELLKSVKRQPTDFTIQMIRRIQNSGQTKIVNIEIVDLYAHILNHPLITDDQRKSVKSYVENNLLK